jgi:hypothetical protein
MYVYACDPRMRDYIRNFVPSSSGKRLLTSSANVNAKDEKDRTPLRFASDNNTVQDLMSLPAEVRDVFRSIPPENTWISREQNISVANRLKLWIEDKTLVRWNWWPLQPGK